MKIHILYDIKDTTWGGGNQFLKNLRHKLQSLGAYAETVEDADVIIFNSHHQMKEVLRAKMHYPEKHFVHRIGSVFSLARGDKRLDRLVIKMNEMVADGTIFQSKWQRDTYHSIGLRPGLECVIMNAPDSEVFNTRKSGVCDRDKIRLITTGWSTGDIKGFDIYEYLDEHLDFKRYQFLFIGNSKKKFKNIESFPPQITGVVASLLKGSDIFITATQHDACSNSLLEAMHCGLPAVARNSGGHPEIVGNGGVLFKWGGDILWAIEEVVENLGKYRSATHLPDDNKVAETYFEFCNKVWNFTTPKEYKNGDYTKIDAMIKFQRAGEILRELNAKIHTEGGA